MTIFSNLSPLIKNNLNYVLNLGAKNDLQEIGIAGFKTLSYVRQKAERTLSVPVSYLESGNPVNDHIVRNPIIIDIEGVVSNQFVVLQSSPPLDTRARAVIGKINAFLPERTLAETQKVTQLIDTISDRARDLDNLVNRTKNLYSYLGNQSETKNNIGEFIRHIDSVQKSDTLVSIEFKYERFDNMAITFFDYEVDNEKESLDFRITATQLRFADTIFVEETNGAKNPSQDLGGKTESTTNKGSQKGTEPVESLATKLRDYFFQ